MHELCLAGTTPRGLILEVCVAYFSTVFSRRLPCAVSVHERRSRCSFNSAVRARRELPGRVCREPGGGALSLDVARGKHHLLPCGAQAALSECSDFLNVRLRQAIMHGERDPIVPFTMGQMLRGAFPDTK